GAEYVLILHYDDYAEVKSLRRAWADYVNLDVWLAGKSPARNDPKLTMTPSNLDEISRDAPANPLATTNG
ncbi:MAG: hypothetical protein M3081_20525, partial [Gemmatimonadota bacterium]|nr:hypothetical protein [Gemmatimonadota bacterium]